MSETSEAYDAAESPVASNPGVVAPETSTGPPAQPAESRMDAFMRMREQTHWMMQRTIDTLEAEHGWAARFVMGKLADDGESIAALEAERDALCAQLAAARSEIDRLRHAIRDQAAHGREGRRVNDDE